MWRAGEWRGESVSWEEYKILCLCEKPVSYGRFLYDVKDEQALRSALAGLVKKGCIEISFSDENVHCNKCATVVVNYKMTSVGYEYIRAYHQQGAIKLVEWK